MLPHKKKPDWDNSSDRAFLFFFTGEESSPLVSVNCDSYGFRLKILDFAHRIASETDAELAESLAVDFAEHDGRMDLRPAKLGKLVKSQFAVLVDKAHH